MLQRNKYLVIRVLGVDWRPRLPSAASAGSGLFTGDL